MCTGSDTCQSVAEVLDLTVQRVLDCLRANSLESDSLSEDSWQDFITAPSSSGIEENVPEFVSC